MTQLMGPGKRKEKGVIVVKRGEQVGNNWVVRSRIEKGVLIARTLICPKVVIFMFQIHILW